MQSQVKQLSIKPNLRDVSSVMYNCSATKSERVILLISKLLHSCSNPRKILISVASFLFTNEPVVFLNLFKEA